MPKRKRGAPRLSRYERGKEQKRGNGWQSGAIAKAKLKADAKAESVRPAAREAREKAAEQRFPAPATTRTEKARKPPRQPKTGANSVAARKRKRQSREADVHVAGDGSEHDKRRQLRAKAADLPKDIGATAASRHAAFDGSADSARQKAEYHVRIAMEHVGKLSCKGKHEEAAATLGGLVRHPDVRPLLVAAGVQLSEDADLDSTLVDNVVDAIGSLGGRSERGNRSYKERGVHAMLTGLVSGASPKKLKASNAKRKSTADVPEPATAPAAKAPAADAPSSAGSSEPSVRALARRLKLPVNSASRKLQKARAARRALNGHEERAYVVETSRRVHGAGRFKITPEKLQRLVEWISRSEYIRTCPMRKQTLLIRGSDAAEMTL